MEKQTFFDVHMHAFNLSHAGLLAFVNRFLLDGDLTLSDVYKHPFRKIVLPAAWKALKNLPSSLFKRKPEKGSGLCRTVNVLSIFENDIARQFQYLELDYLRFSRNPKLIDLIDSADSKINYRDFSKLLQEKWVESGHRIFIGDLEIDKVILTPLMMDFNFKGFHGLDPELIHYHLRPRKQIKDQAVDLFTGILQYYKYSDIKLFEIYPFMAINTDNLETGQEEYRYYEKSMVDLLDKYFSDFSVDDTGNKRYEILKNKLVTYSETRKLQGAEGYELLLPAFYFAGIKLYPPLGFDPWPGEPENRKKACLLYDYCSSKGIPMITHCSDGGFNVVGSENSKRYTDPGRWENALKAYPGLRIDFAHDGIHQGNKVDNEWKEKILRLALDYPNVYFDISYNGYEMNYYERMMDFILIRYNSASDLEKISSRMLFGTDFMVNLFDVDSYYEYVKYFSLSRAFEKSQYFPKTKLCNQNPARFLFG